jgi:hypothetical protein
MCETSRNINDVNFRTKKNEKFFHIKNETTERRNFPFSFKINIQFLALNSKEKNIRLGSSALNKEVKVYKQRIFNLLFIKCIRKVILKFNDTTWSTEK